jgi:hypothetical protein
MEALLSYDTSGCLWVINQKALLSTGYGCLATRPEKENKRVDENMTAHVEDSDK